MQIVQTVQITGMPYWNFQKRFGEQLVDRVSSVQHGLLLGPRGWPDFPIKPTNSWKFICKTILRCLADNALFRKRPFSSCGACGLDAETQRIRCFRPSVSRFGPDNSLKTTRNATKTMAETCTEICKDSSLDLFATANSEKGSFSASIWFYLSLTQD